MTLVLIHSSPVAYTKNMGYQKNKLSKVTRANQIDSRMHSSHVDTVHNNKISAMPCLIPFFLLPPPLFGTQINVHIYIFICLTLTPPLSLIRYKEHMYTSYIYNPNPNPMCIYLCIISPGAARTRSSSGASGGNGRTR